MDDFTLNPEGDIDAQLAELEQKILADQEEPKTEAPKTEEPKAEEPQAPNPVDFNDMVPAVKSALANMTPEKRAEALSDWQKAVEQKQQQEEQKVATGAVRKTTDEMLSEIRKGVPDELLPSDYDERDPHEQFAILNFLQTELKAEAKKEEALAPYRQQEAQMAHERSLDETAKGWANDLGKPEAEKHIRDFIGQFPPQYVEMYKQEMANGGGPLMTMVSQQVRGIVDSLNRQDEAKTEIPLPKSEDVVPAEDGPQLSPSAQGIYDDLKASGMDENELKRYRKELAGVK